VSSNEVGFNLQESPSLPRILHIGVLGEKPLLLSQWFSSFHGIFIALFKCHVGRQKAPGLEVEKNYRCKSHSRLWKTV